MGYGLAIHLCALVPNWHTIYDWVNGESTTCTRSDSSNGYLCIVVVEANSTATVVWFFRIFVVENCVGSIAIELHECSSICSTTVLAHPYIAILVVLYLCASIVDHIARKDASARCGIPHGSSTEVIFVAIEMLRSEVDDSFLAASEHEEFEVFARSLYIKADVRSSDEGTGLGIALV